ncbi:MAG TPA: hypothetical protein VHG70_17895 [Nocardioidaceae bacterium]|nr:hypothetical protein [Nocardioidaceae bacterium]
MTPAVRRPLAAATAVLALTLSACGGGDAEQAAAQHPEQRPTGGATASGGGAGGARGASGSDAHAAGAARLQPAAGDLANFSCAPRRKVWSAHGDITNSAKEPMVYTVTVVTVAGTDVAGDDSDRFVLGPGESTSFEFPGVSRGSADACMPRVVRAPR